MEVMPVAVVGSVQVYVRPLTAGTLAVNVPPVQAVAGLNVMVPGVAGVVPTVIFAVLGALVPQALVAVTEIAKLPVVVPALVMLMVVPSLPSWVILPGTVQL